MFLLASVLLGLWLAKPITAKAPQPDSQDYTSGPLVIKDNAIQPPAPLQQLLPENPIPSNAKQLVRRDNPQRTNASTGNKEFSGRSYSKEEVQQLIKDYSAQYGINPEIPLCIAKLESGYNQFSKNKSSTASGIFQYLDGTWRGTDEGLVGYSVFDADANVKAAIKYMASRNNTQPWVVNNKCPKLTSNK